MENLSFADKVNQAFGDGWSSNPQFGKALKEIEQVVEENNRFKEQAKTINIEELFIDNTQVTTHTREEDDDAR